MGNASVCSISNEIDLKADFFVLFFWKGISNRRELINKRKLGGKK